MKQTLYAIGLLLVTTQHSIPEKDPFRWLEEVEGEKAIDWVKARNQDALDLFESDERFEPMRKDVEAILQATDRIPFIRQRGDLLYNFWQDKNHVRGIWRTTTLEEYRKDEPTWNVLLDIDRLGREEKKSWVYKGVDFLAPQYERCLVRLSPGGTDASEWREFDVKTKTFVKDGFHLPEAKSNVEWLDENTLLVGTDFGPDSLTDSGYPRIVKRWKRGTPLEEAETVFEGEKDDVSVGPWVTHRPEGRTVILDRSPTFFTSRLWLLGEQDKKQRIPVPENIQINGIFQDRILVTLNRDWKDYPLGSMIAMNLADVRAGKEEPRTGLIYRPDDRSAISRYGALADMKDELVLHVMTDVRSRFLSLRFDEEGRAHTREMPVPQTGSLQMISASSFKNDLFFSYEDFLTPETLFYLPEGKDKAEPLKSIPDRFDASRFKAEQHFVEAKDGERIPYFVIGPKAMELNGTNPTLLYGYGGFIISMNPSYLTTVGKLWLERGGVYVMATIRGGGEYGPRWHQAALKENRQVAFDDFIAIGEDLIERKITSPKHLGIMGGSNGGLLVGAVMTQRPELMNAVICQVPLLDMLRFNKLLAGASWMGEYGDPDDPEMREVIRKYSPYHNVLPAKERAYPDAFFITSTKDDRVHPGHARKMVARMRAEGHKVYYYENIEGGHSAAADLRQTARRKALETVYLLRQLKD
ncbi:MAG: prolyl oligopeptidase family serine peptidase [Verrucomicrobiota bacterium]